MEQKFGKWVVNDYGMDYIKNGIKPYHIEKLHIWKTTIYRDILVWDWFIHLTDKDWFDNTSLNDFKDAFAFALEQFQQDKPANSKSASINQSYNFAKQLIVR